MLAVRLHAQAVTVWMSCSIIRVWRESLSRIQNHSKRVRVLEFFIAYASLQSCGVLDYQILHKIS
jgi:hypothetical protein